MNTGDYRSTMVDSVNECLRVTSNWIRDLQIGDSLELSERVVMTMQAMVMSCADRQSVTQDCMDLYMRVHRFAEELHQYVRKHDDKVQPDGSPAPSFWGAIKALQEAVNKTETVYIAQLESVAELRAQKVSDDQIANHIYGYKGIKGPFLTPGGMINKRALDKAASSLEAQDEILRASGWEEIDGVFVPPWSLNKSNSKTEEFNNRLQAFAKLEAGPKRYEDPQSIEDLILAGAFVEQIIKAKHCTYEEVMSAAIDLGIEVKHAPGGRPPLKKRPTAENTDTDVNATEPKPATKGKGPGKAAKPKVEIIKTTEKSLLDDNQDDLPEMPGIAELEKQAEDSIEEGNRRYAVIACMQGNPKYGPAEIIADLKQDGIMVDEIEVSRIIADHKKASRQNATAN